jgi:hypothetical protein
MKAKHSKKTDKSHRGNASQFYVAAELCRRGHAALVTVGNTPNTDILCSNRSGTKFVHVQVKTFRPGRDKTCTVGAKSEKDYGENFFWVLAGVPEPDESTPFKYFIVPSKVLAENVKQRHDVWLKTPGKNNRKHKDSSIRSVAVRDGASSCFWSVLEYEGRWDLMERMLAD